jgi:hypothetical protein
MSQTVLAGSLFDQKTGNLLANGGFEMWNLGTSFVDASNGTYILDNWFTARDALAGYTITKETSIVDTGASSLKCVTNVGGGTYWYMQQTYDATSLRGKTISISARVRTNVASGVRVRLYAVSGTNSAYHSGGGAFETLTATQTIDPSATVLQVLVGFLPGDLKTATTYIDSVIMIVGTKPVDYAPENPEIEKVKGGALSAVQANLPNILVNGGFEIWQRGSIFNNPATLAYTADKWMFETNGSANTQIERSGVAYEGNYSASLVLNSIGSSTFLNLRQDVESPIKYRGKTLTLSMRVRANTANAVYIQMTDSAGSVVSSFHTGGDTYELLTVTKAIYASTTELIIRVSWNTTFTPTKYFVADSAMLVLGNQPIDYVPEDQQIQLARCQRYCQVIGGAAGTVEQAVGMCYSTTAFETHARLPVEMASAPVATVVSPTSWRAYNSALSGIATTSLAASASGQKSSVYMVGTVASGLVAGNATMLSSNGGSAYILLEA